MKRILLTAIIFARFTSLHAQWVQTIGPEGAQVESLVSDGVNLYAGAYANNTRAIYMSRNQGVSWTLLKLTGTGAIRSIAVRGDTIFAGTDGKGVYRTVHPVVPGLPSILVWLLMPS